MVWNTIAHPRMMAYKPGSGENNAPMFSEEVLASPIKHMNRDLLATFDAITMTLMDDSSPKVLKIIPLLGDFDTIYRMTKNKTIIHGLLIVKYVETSADGTISSSADRPTRVSSYLYNAGIFEGQRSIGDEAFDFKDVCFVAPSFEESKGFVYASDGAVYDMDTWVRTILPKYNVGTDSESGKPTK